MSKTYIAHLPERYIEKRSDGEEWLQMPVNVSGHELTIKTVIPLTPYAEPDLAQVMKETYQRGLNDAWETARWLAKSNAGINFKIFGRHFTNEIVQEISASEAIEKIKAYEQEQEQIRVGDEVIGIYSSGEQTKPFVITKVISDYYFGIYSDSGEFCQGGLKLQKTGRHFPEIAEALKKMKEETA